MGDVTREVKGSYSSHKIAEEEDRSGGGEPSGKTQEIRKWKILLALPYAQPEESVRRVWRISIKRPSRLQKVLIQRAITRREKRGFFLMGSQDSQPFLKIPRVSQGGSVQAAWMSLP